MFLLLLLTTAVHGLIVDESLSSQDVVNMLLHQQAMLNTVKEEIAQLKEQGCAQSCPATQSPSFMVSLTQTMDQCGINTPVVFEKVRLNIGSGYDNRHGTFRAPHNGTYFFSATLSVTPSKAFHVAFVKNSKDTSIDYLLSDASSIFHERSTTVITRLKERRCVDRMLKQQFLTRRYRHWGIPLPLLRVYD